MTATEYYETTSETEEFMLAQLLDAIDAAQHHHRVHKALVKYKPLTAADRVKTLIAKLTETKQNTYRELSTIVQTQ